jgi:asparagine synthase (glutamine-hydrolysing)
VRHGIENPFTGNLHEGIEELERRLKTAVGLRMEADVPLGAFLSGGIDSSAIVSMMQAQATSSVRTFTIAFSEASYDESGRACEVAVHLDTDHTELLVTPKDALAVIPRLASIYDEPFADASQIPTCLLSHLTRRHVTVAVSGDGADELLGGYYRHFMAPKLWGRLARLPQPLRQSLAAIASNLPESLWHNIFTAAKRIGCGSFAVI